MPGPHDKIIADAAKSALGPLNFRRKGRSRLWLADHGWWLTVVEFQPSSWSKGSYLNVAAHWLWSEAGHVSFDFGGRVQEHTAYRSDAQFTPLATRLAEKAAQEAQRLAERFTSLKATANVLVTNERTGHEQVPGFPGWSAYHAGIAAGLVGRAKDATEMFERVLKGPAQPDSMLRLSAERMAKLASEPFQLRSEVVSRVELQRDALRLPPLGAQLARFSLWDENRQSQVSAATRKPAGSGIPRTRRR